MIRNRLAVGGLVVGLLGGGVAGAIFGVPSLVAAQDGTTTTSTSEATTTEAPTTEAPTTVAPKPAAPTPADNGGGDTTTTAPPASGATGNADDGANGKHSRDQHLKDALAPLVTNGTITQAQADAVIKALEDAAPKGEGHGGRGMGGFGFGGLRAEFNTAAKMIGIPPGDLMKAIVGGQSIADVAKAHSVDPQKVIDALVADAKARLDKAVGAKKITQDQADQILLKEAKVIGDVVNGSLPTMPFGFGHGGPGFGHGAPGDQGDSSSTQHD